MAESRLDKVAARGQSVWIDLLSRELVHVTLAREVVGRRSERAVRALAQRRPDRMELDSLVRDVVRRRDPGRAGVVIVELPRGERAVLLRAAPDLDQAARPQIGPRELFFPRPHDLDGLAGGLRKASGLDAASPVCLPP